MGTVYKVVECSPVTDENLERVLNQWTHEGWLLESISFVPNDASKRPRLAFVLFTRTGESLANDEVTP